MRRTTNTGFKGVTERSDNKGYEATVYIDGNRVFYKGTKTLQEAVQARTSFVSNLL